ncbi:MAG: MarR family winged helix-turn-helix transcriptional regulator [Puia sp.]|nr:MarR family winged helix-turn-helix transcriptional regulator [Puia sp.]
MENANYEEMSLFVDAVVATRQAIKHHFQQKLKETKSEVTYEMVQVLNVLWKKRKVNQQEIANAVQKGKASLTVIIDQLSQLNLVIRSEDPADRRNKIIRLTKEGLTYKRKFEPVMREFYASFNTGIPAQKIREVTGLLLKMAGHIRK